MGLIAMSLGGCKKPELREDAETTKPPLEEVPQGSETSKDYREIRRETIGRKFAKLTLGTRQFTDVEVLDITDEIILIKHRGGTDEIPWSEMPAEVQDRWGYRPDTTTLVEKLSKVIPKREAVENPVHPPVSAPEAKTPQRSPQEKAQEIARQQKMLEAQMLGIRGLESDFSRESQRLDDLRRRYQLSLARQKAQGGKGIRIERVDGESTLIDRAKEARELKAQIEALEPLVAQLSKALFAARQNYHELKTSFERTIGE
ncbi:MAG: hypothetical protein P1U86_05390 [Verrucomicrobiales bacterium]|nr:hypothetical protein [Verrucomicrobiales bacterium]